MFNVYDYIFLFKSKNTKLIVLVYFLLLKNKICSINFTIVSLIFPGLQMQY